jgi:hypothetical protein
VSWMQRTNRRNASLADAVIAVEFERSGLTLVSIGTGSLELDGERHGESKKVRFTRSKQCCVRALTSARVGDCISMTDPLDEWLWESEHPHKITVLVK